jgi:predicted transcriptional regulator
MTEENGKVDSLTKLCKAFSSENRVEMFLKLLDKKKPVDIATELDISRAGLQKHIESLLETGLLVKKGSGRNTKYQPTEISQLVLQHLERLGNLLETQREVLKLENTLSAIESVPENLGDTSKTDFVSSLKDELTKRTEMLNETSETLRTSIHE